MKINNYDNKQHKITIKWRIQLLKNRYQIKIPRYKIPKVIQQLDRIRKLEKHDYNHNASKKIQWIKKKIYIYILLIQIWNII